MLQKTMENRNAFQISPAISVARQSPIQKTRGDSHSSVLCCDNSFDRRHLPSSVTSEDKLTQSGKTDSAGAL
ncbi:hypothetical protein QUF90_25195 [Desulfococcaceae bacterium HSG9]|nr:hypothetical protein [Desulfococcaceae bacterium HSG9]